MKTTIFLLLCFLSFAASRAQIPDLTGTWTMFEMTYKTSEGLEIMSEDEMKSNGSVTDFIFMEEGKFKQTSNMSGSGTMDTYEGNWKLMETELILSLNINERLMDIVWDVEFKDLTMNLSRTSPDGSLTIINSFRRK
ncbi:MAG: hypothetical protein IH594_09590 [Bacteroidales bacterium]|nr:hypothetical protein [Bacteroidales bacterium]